MQTTRAFRSGNSQAIRIPADLAYEDPSVELTVTRQGEMLIIEPARPSIREMVEALRALPRPPEVEVREPVEVPEREGN